MEMSTQVLQQSRHTLTLSGEERETLLELLRKTLGEVRIEVHRTHTPSFRESVLCHEALIRTLIEKLERPGPDQSESSPRIRGGIEEGASLIEELYIDEGGRFQMSTEDLEGFIRFLRDNEVRVEEETADAFHSGGKAYGYGRLLHLFDADSVSTLYRTWKLSREI
jgi:hypothetical protein